MAQPDHGRRMQNQLRVFAGFATLLPCNRLPTPRKRNFDMRLSRT